MADQHDRENNSPRLMGQEAAATYLDIAPRTVHRRVHKGLLKPVQIPGVRRKLFDKQDLDALVETVKVSSSR